MRRLRVGRYRERLAHSSAALTDWPLTGDAVEMMHSELELVESIKQNEESVDAVNSRVEYFKVCVLWERIARRKKLRC